MITSLLDTDLYKFTMMQVIFHRFPDATAEYHYVERRAKHDLSPYIPQIQAAIHQLCTLNFSASELAYLQSLGYFKTDFLDYLQTFSLDSKHITLNTTPEFGLTIKGPWLNTILFEVPILAIISETMNQILYPTANFALGHKNLKIKINQAKNCNNLRFTDFGTRRRFSHAWQGEVLTQLQQQLPQQFTGTSNVYYAKKLGLKPVGTMAHEYIQAFQAFTDPINSQIAAFNTWLEEYPDVLGIALSDTLGLKKFLQDFNQTLAHQYQGIRQDSGDPVPWTEQILQHYKKLGIDPKTKTLVYSDALTIKTAISLVEKFSEQTNLFFGIGTHLTNDLGCDPLDIVIKMVRCNGKPVAKISDNPEKAVCVDVGYLEKLIKTCQ